MSRTSKKAPMVKVHRKRKAAKANLPRLRLSAWHLSLSQLLIACFVSILLAAAYGSFYVIDAVLEVPVEQVTVHGKFTYLQQDLVSDVIAQYVDDGFMQVSLKRLYQELSTLPWVYTVLIKRELPSGLSIHIEEQQTAAYWNDRELINQYGEVFSPDKMPVIHGIPRFSGKQHEQVLAVYQQLKSQLPASFRPIKALALDQRQVLKAQTYNDIELVMKLDEMKEQVDKWLLIANTLETEQLEKVRKVDLRYSNGAAIEWQNSVAAITNNLIGGQL